MTKLPKETIVKLRSLEKKLRAAVSMGTVEEAIEIAAQIQELFTDRKHHRLLKAKLWAFQAALDANRLAYAESGFSGIRQLANKCTRIYLEASALLAVVLLLEKDLTQAKRKSPNPNAYQERPCISLPAEIKLSLLALGRLTAFCGQGLRRARGMLGLDSRSFPGVHRLGHL